MSGFGSLVAAQGNILVCDSIEVALNSFSPQVIELSFDRIVGGLD